MSAKEVSLVFFYCDLGNLIFSAPTSAGKSLVADLMVLRHLNQVKNSMCIVILPYLSLIIEKETKIAPLLKRLGLSYISVHSHKRPILPEDDPPRLIFCTIEKANQMFNKLLEKNQINKVTCVLVDELHLIGDDQRGYLLELLLTKLKFLC
jgi:DNA polymerase theta